MRLVVRGLSVAHHGHDIRERDTRTVVLVGIEENTETLELVCRSEDGTLRGALLGEPESEAIAVQVALAVELKLQFDLRQCEFDVVPAMPSSGLLLTCQLVAVRGTREKIHPCCEGRSAVRRMYLARHQSVCNSQEQKTRDLLISTNHRISSEVEPAALEIRI